MTTSGTIHIYGPITYNSYQTRSDFYLSKLSIKIEGGGIEEDSTWDYYNWSVYSLTYHSSIKIYRPIQLFFAHYYPWCLEW